MRANISILASDDSRGSPRRRLRLATSGETPQDSVEVLIQDLSHTGLLIETDAELEVNEIFLVDLPEAGATEARIVRKEGSVFGCEFLTPISQAALSAAILQASFPGPAPIGPHIEEVPVAVSPSVDDITAWQAEFEETKGRLGYKLMGFRQTSDGLLLAIIAKTD